MLWFQGWDQAPPIVRACRATWEARNPGWTVRALSAVDLHRYVPLDVLAPCIGGKHIEPEALSDIFRIALLERHGGVWVDSTLYCLQPLDEWLPAVTGSGFFAFARPKPDRMVASWFLAGARGNPIVQAWYRQVLDYWQHRSHRHHYFWFHYLFAQCHDSDPLFREQWRRTPERLAEGPHYYVPYTGLDAPLSARDYQLLEGGATPLLKLTHKLPQAHYPDDSILGHLINRALAHPHREAVPAAPTSG